MLWHPTAGDGETRGRRVRVRGLSPTQCHRPLPPATGSQEIFWETKRSNRGEAGKMLFRDSLVAVQLVHVLQVSAACKRPKAFQFTSL